MSTGDDDDPDRTQLRDDTVPVRPRSDEGTLTGQRLGDFQLRRLLGRGGMGEVYLADQISLRRKVALKVLRPDLSADEQYLRRFEAEAQAAAPISHPGIVGVYAVGEERGRRYIALEYVPGLNLKEYIDRQGPLEVTAAVAVMRKVAAALERAREEGLVHRDVKPENVLLTRKGDVKVADFGLARTTAADRVHLTQTDMTLGTPLYMAPEQVEGKPVDHRTDLYALGGTAYHMLAGQPPFTGGTSMAVALAHVRDRPAPLSRIRDDLPAPLTAIVERLLAKDPADRFQSAREVLLALQRLRGAGLTGAVVGLDGLDDDLELVEAAPARVGPRRRLAALLATPRRRAAAVAACAALASVGGFAAARRMGGVRIEPAAPILSAGADDPIPVPVEPVPRAATLKEQYDLALAQPVGQREPYLWAVLDRRQPNRETDDATYRLAATYLLEHRHIRAEELADWLLRRDNGIQQAGGAVLQAAVRQRTGRPPAEVADSLATALDRLERLDPGWLNFASGVRRSFLDVFLSVRPDLPAERAAGLLARYRRTLPQPLDGADDDRSRDGRRGPGQDGSR